MESDENRAPDSDTCQAPTSGPCKASGAFQAIAERFLRPLTQEEQAARSEREAKLRADAIRAEHDRKQRRFAEFIGDRAEYATCKFSAWKYAGGQHGARQEEVVQAAIEFASGVPDHRKTGTGCVFYGPPGTGKDHLAACIVREACLQHGHSAKYLNGVEWFIALRDAMGNDKKSEGDVVRESLSHDWVILSDPLPPGNEPLTAYQSSMLYRLVEARSAQHKPTIVTINVKDGDEATRRLGGATWDRLKHRAWVFACNWPSFRKPARVV